MFIYRQGKFASTFFSTSTIGGGQETTALSLIPFFTHVGMIYVPFGYKSPRMGDNSEVHGGSPYGAGKLYLLIQLFNKFKSIFLNFYRVI